MVEQNGRMEGRKTKNIRTKEVRMNGSKKGLKEGRKEGRK